MGLIEQNILELAASSERERLHQIAARWDAYYGRHRRPLRVLPGKFDDNVIVNYARVIVDKGVSFLFGDGVRFELDETNQTAAEVWLNDVWSRNRQATLLHKLALDGAICGHAFVKITNPASPRLVIVDPATVQAFWLPDDVDEVVRYRIQYPAIDPDTGKSVVIRQEIARDGDVWRITDSRASGGGRFVVTSEQVWPKPWPPIVGCQNLPAPHEFWGISDLEADVMQINDALNRVASNIARILRFHAHPRTWARGVAAGQLRMDIGVDEILTLPSPDAELRNLEMASDLQSSLQFMMRLREALHEISRVPEVATGAMERVGQLSGVALSILYQPLIEKTLTKRMLYGDMLVELNRRLLELGGWGEDMRTTIHWPEMLPGDPLAMRQVALLDQQLGVSRDTLLRQMGYDADVESMKRAQEMLEDTERAVKAYWNGNPTATT